MSAIHIAWKCDNKEDYIRRWNEAFDQDIQGNHKASWLFMRCNCSPVQQQTVVVITKYQYLARISLIAGHNWRSTRATTSVDTLKEDKTFVRFLNIRNREVSVIGLMRTSLLFLTWDHTTMALKARYVICSQTFPKRVPVLPVPDKYPIAFQYYITDNWLIERF